jgi:hypothetical protein
MPTWEESVHSKRWQDLVESGAVAEALESTKMLEIADSAEVLQNTLLPPVISVQITSSLPLSHLNHTFPAHDSPFTMFSESLPPWSSAPRLRWEAHPDSPPAPYLAESEHYTTPPCLSIPQPLLRATSTRMPPILLAIQIQSSNMRRCW